MPRTGQNSDDDIVERLLRIIEQASNRPQEPLAYIQWCRESIESWRDEHALKHDAKLIRRSLEMLGRCETALRERSSKGIASALDAMWCASGAYWMAIFDADAEMLIARAPAFLAGKRKPSAKDWARTRHAELMAETYDLYRDQTQKDQAKRLWHDWSQGPGKARRKKKDTEKKDAVVPSAATFRRYRTDF
jgi:hypothetical protein